VLYKIYNKVSIPLLVRLKVRTDRFEIAIEASFNSTIGSIKRIAKKRVTQFATQVSIPLLVRLKVRTGLL